MKDRITIVPGGDAATAKSPQALERRWWTVKEKQRNGPGAAAWDVAKLIAEDSATHRRMREWLAYARLYCNQSLSSLRGARMIAERVVGAQPVLTFNAIQSVVDTMANRIAKNKPRMTCLTQGGDFALKQRGKGLTKFIDGTFDEADTYTHTQAGFVDGEIFGTGFYHPFRKGGKFCGERVLPFEVLVDETEALYGEPRSMYRNRPVHRELLLRKHGKSPEKRLAIERAPGLSEDGKSSSQTSDVIQVVEAWHRPSGEGAGDGLHVLGLEGVTLQSLPWDYDYHPLIPIRWNRKPWGYWGQGLPELLAGLQFELNGLLETIATAQRLMSVPRVLIPVGSKITKSHINNLIGALIQYKGDKAPQFVTAAAVHPELYQHLERLYLKMFEVTGVPQMNATGTKPAGLNAAVALREYNDINNERHVLPAQAFEEVHRKAAIQYIDMAREEATSDEEDGETNDPTVMVESRRAITPVKFSKVDMERDKYVLRVFPTSILPTTPAGRLATVQELIESGMIDVDTGYALLDWPDLESASNVKLAALKDIERVLDRIVEDGEYEPPEEFMALDKALRMTQSALLNARMDNAPDDRIDMLTRFLEEVRVLMVAAQPAPAAAPAPMQQQSPDIAQQMAGTEAVPSMLGAQMVA